MLNFVLEDKFEICGRRSHSKTPECSWSEIFEISGFEGGASLFVKSGLGCEGGSLNSSCHFETRWRCSC